MKIVLKSVAMLLFGAFALASCQKEETLGVERADSIKDEKLLSVRSSASKVAYAVTYDNKIYRVSEFSGTPLYNYTVTLNENGGLSSHHLSKIAVDNNGDVYLCAKSDVTNKIHIYKAQEVINTEPVKDGFGNIISGTGTLTFTELYSLKLGTTTFFGVWDIEIYGGKIYGISAPIGASHTSSLFIAPLNYSNSEYDLQILNNDLNSEMDIAPGDHLLSLANSDGKLLIVHKNGTFAQVYTNGQLTTPIHHYEFSYQPYASILSICGTSTSKGLMTFNFRIEEGAHVEFNQFKLYDYETRTFIIENETEIIEKVVNLGSHNLELSVVTPELGRVL